MSTESQKGKKTRPVRIWEEVKSDLETFVIDRAAKERKSTTEADEASKAVKAYLKKEKRKLGIA
jgi:hypothetical protein